MRSGETVAFQTAFWWACGIAVLAILPALTLPSIHRDKADKVSGAGSGT